MSGQVHFTYLPISSALPHVQSGKLRILANAGSKRSAFAPDIPTLGELGHPTLDFDLWFGFLGPADLPPAIVRWWENELAAVAETAEAREAFRRHGITPLYLDADRHRRPAQIRGGALDRGGAEGRARAEVT